MSTQAIRVVSLALGIGSKKDLVAVADCAEASRLYRAACDAHMERTGQGASTMQPGLLYDCAGATPTRIGYVSWNGKVWAGSERGWKPGDEPLYSPYAEAVPA